jgi:hypothetical protein
MDENQKDSTKKFIRLFVFFMLGCGLVFIVLSFFVK